MPFRQRLLVFLLLISVSCFMRFYRLGEWSFGFDELFTKLETKAFIDGTPVPEEYLKGGTLRPEDTQVFRLPRIVPAAYFVHWLDFMLFGEDEFGSRVLMAAIGSLGVGVIFLLALPLFGKAGSVTLALFILLWPEHVLQCQDCRFYSQAFFFISIVLLLGGHVVARRSTAAALWLGPMAFLTVLSHALGGVIWGVLLCGVVIDMVVRRLTTKSLSYYQKQVNNFPKVMRAKLKWSIAK